MRHDEVDRNPGLQESFAGMSDMTMAQVLHAVRLGKMDPSQLFLLMAQCLRDIRNSVGGVQTLQSYKLCSFQAPTGQNFGQGLTQGFSVVLNTHNQNFNGIKVSLYQGSIAIALDKATDSSQAKAITLVTQPPWTTADFYAQATAAPVYFPMPEMNQTRNIMITSDPSAGQAAIGAIHLIRF